MALFKICRGAENNLPTTRTDGYAYFCTDTGSFFIDWKNSSGEVLRSKISSNFADGLRYKDGDNVIEIDPATILTTINPILATANSNGLMSSADKEKLDGLLKRNWYGTCETAASATTKLVTTTSADFQLFAGAELTVYFTYASSAETFLLNVDDTGAKSVYTQGSSITSYVWPAKSAVSFVYDGEAFRMVDGYRASASNYGIVKTSSTYTEENANTVPTTTALYNVYQIADSARQSANSHTHDVASSATAGFMSADDKTKLDGIPSTIKNSIWISVSSSTSNYKLNQYTYDDIIDLLSDGYVVYLYITYTSGATHVYHSVGTVKYSNYDYVVPEFIMHYNNTSAKKLVVHPESAYPDGNVLMSSNTLVSTSRTINGHALSSNVTLSAADVEALPITGGTLTGALTLAADPSSELEAATKQYVDAHIDIAIDNDNGVHGLRYNSANGSIERYDTDTDAWVEAASGKSDNIFIAEYGVTTYEDIITAWDSGKACFCKRVSDTTLTSNKLYSLSYMSETIIYFGVPYSNLNYWCSINTNNTWSANSTSLQTTARLTTAIDSSSTNTNYPSAKAVYTFVTGLIGNVEAVAAEIDTLIGE